MKAIRKTLCLLLCLLLAFSCTGCGMQGMLPVLSSVDSAAVTVGDRSYTEGQVNYIRALAKGSLNVGGYQVDYNTLVAYFGEEAAKEFLDEAVNSILIRNAALLRYAEKEDVRLSEGEKQLAEDRSNELMAQLRAGAANYGMKESAYLEAVFGPGVTENVIRGMIEEETLVTKAYMTKTCSLSITPEEIAAYYPEPVDGDSFDYAFFLTDRETAASIIESCQEQRGAEEDPLLVLTDIISEQLPGDYPSVRSEVLGIALEEAFRPWLLDEARKPGDLTFLEAEDGSGWYVLLFRGRSDNTQQVSAVRHILVKAQADENGEISDRARAEARARAEEILESFLSGEGGEIEFALLASLLSADWGSASAGGLYSQVRQGQMVPNFDAFCFAEHQYGDTEVVDGESANYAGSHVIFFVERLPAREAAAKAALRQAAMEDWYAEITADLEPVWHEQAGPAPQAGSQTERDGERYHHVQIEIRDYGTVTLELDSQAAPITVQNFLELAGEGFYDGLTFHRIMDGFMIQGGDPQGNGMGGSGKNIKGEFALNGWNNPISHQVGVISMARSRSYDSASSQFFICVGDASFLDGQYAAFGIVTEGLDIVLQIAKDARPVDNNGTIPAAQQPVIERITVLD